MRKTFLFTLFLLITTFCSLILATGCNQQSVSISLSSPAIAPNAVAANQPVTIAVNALNTGKSQLIYTLDLKINGNEIESKNITVNGGETTTVSFQYTPTTKGSYSVDLNGQIGTFEAVNPAHIVIGALQTSSETALNKAAQEGTLISVQSLSNGFPVDSAQAYLAYAESNSLVGFLIDKYGWDKMQGLLTAFKEGTTQNDALQTAYGFDIKGLETLWKATLPLS